MDEVLPWIEGVAFHAVVPPIAAYHFIYSLTRHYDGIITFKFDFIIIVHLFISHSHHAGVSPITRRSCLTLLRLLLANCMMCNCDYAAEE